MLLLKRFLVISYYTCSAICIYLFVVAPVRVYLDMNEPHDPPVNRQATGLYPGCRATGLPGYRTVGNGQSLTNYEVRNTKYIPVR